MSSKRWRPLFRLPRINRRALARDLEHQLDDELAFHLRMREERLAELGLSPEDARAVAIARFGDHERIRTECLTIDQQYAREMTMMDWLESITADVRFALPLSAARPPLPPSPRSRSHSASPQRPRSSAWSTAFCFGRFPIRTPSSSCG